MYKVTLENRRYDISQLKSHYRFTDDDAALLKELKPVIKEALPDLLKGFYEYIFSFEHAKLFLHDENILNKHQDAISDWFMDLFSGVYDNDYFQRLHNISETHVQIGLPSHYVNCAFSYIREYLDKLLVMRGTEEDLYAMNKIIDINLDILSLTYQQEEQQQFINHVVLLKQTIKYQTVIPYVQPIVDTVTGDVVKFECLMRIQHPETYKIYSVYPLLKTAKSIRVYEDLIRIMIKHTLSIFRDLPWSFSLNLGYEDIDNPDFLDFLYKALEDYPNPQRIIFEILESDFIEDFTIVSTFVKKVRRLGCQIAIDDFGSGYSNIENILELKPNFIKIDGSLIKDIDTSTIAMTVVKNVIKMSEELHIKTIAEHVHNEEIYKIVKQLRIDYMQGYYTGEPFPAKELLEHHILYTSCEEES